MATINTSYFALPIYFNVFLLKKKKKGLYFDVLKGLNKLEQ